MGILTTPATGANGRIVLGQEAVFGNIVAPTHLIEFTSESVQASETPIESQGIRGDRAKHDVMRGYLDVGGDISAELAVDGFGILLYNALGVDYEPLNRVDGGYHSRLELGGAAALIDAIPNAAPAAYFLEFAPESVLRFPDAAGQVKFVGRNASGLFVEEVSSTVGYEYSESQGKYLTTIVSATATGTVPSLTALVLTLSKVLDENGVSRNADLASAGVMYLGPRELRVRFTLTSGTPGGTGANLTVTVDPADLAVVTAASDFAANALITIAPGLIDDNGAGTISLADLTNVPKGAWAYLYLDSTAYPAAAYNTIWTHHMEASRTLPAGMTVEIDRDAAIFVYSGMMINSASFSFEPGNPINVTFSMLGRQEYAMAELVEDAKVGDTSIVIRDAFHFPNAGTISVGGSGLVETGVTYTGKTTNADGTYTLTGIPASGVASIQYPHRKGGNVDLRTSTAVANPIEGQNQPLVPFEATAYIDGAVEEVLSATVTINNNLNAEKRGLGDRFRLALVPERRMVEGNLNVEFDDGHNYLKFIKGSFFYVEIRCVSEQEDNCGNGVDETGVLGQMYIIMPSVRYGGTTPNIEGESYITHDLPMMAKYDDCYNTPDLVIITVNRSQEDVDDQGTAGAGI